jgi:hypothetical protein
LESPYVESPSLQLHRKAPYITPSSIIWYGLSLHPPQWGQAEYEELSTCECMLSPLSPASSADSYSITS